MGAFRMALGQVVEANLVLCQGSVPLQAQQYKQHVLHLFHATMSFQAKKLCLLLRVMNGDWRVRGKLQYYTDRDDSLKDRVVIVQWMTSVLMEVYVSHKPVLYPRHRWTGADRALDWFAAMESCHGLFSLTYKVFLSLCGPAANNASMAGIRQHDDFQVADPALPELPVALPHEVTSKEESFNMTSTMDQDESDNPAASLAKDRILAQQWLQKDVLTSMFIMRTVLDPLQELMSGQFYLNGPEFELEQQAHACQHHNAVPRHFMLTKAASQELEKKFFTKLAALFKAPNTWQFIPEVGKTTETNGKIFRLLSRAGCLVLQLYALPHTVYPIKIFQCVHHPETG